MIRTRTRCVRAERGDDWTLVLEVRGRRDVVTRARAGQRDRPVGRHVQRDACCSSRRPRNVRLIAGSHIVVRRLFEHDRGYIFQAPDGRVVFALPFEDDFTHDRHHRPGFFRRSRQRSRRAPTRSAICARSRTIISAPRSSPADVVWSFAGVRPLYGEASPRSRRTRRATMCWRSTASPARRRCSRSMAARSRPIAGWPRRRYDKLAPIFGARPDWTKGAALPGGDFDVDGFERLIAGTAVPGRSSSERHARRLARAYGTRVARHPGFRQEP